MPMDPTGEALAAQILTAIGGATNDARTAAFTAMSKAIVDYIIANALVTVTGTATVTSAPGTAPVVGTGTVS